MTAKRTEKSGSVLGSTKAMLKSDTCMTYQFFGFSTSAYGLATLWKRLETHLSKIKHDYKTRLKNLLEDFSGSVLEASWSRLHMFANVLKRLIE